jgi:hypothetical protein
MDVAQARQKIKALVAEQDRKRGRPLTVKEQLDNLRRAVESTCIECGREVELGARCDCGHMNREEVNF